MKPQEQPRNEWPKMAQGTSGNIARFDCREDMPPGYVVLGEGAPAPAIDDELTQARAAYVAAFGKKPGPKWDAATIRQKVNDKGRLPDDSTED